MKKIFKPTALLFYFLVILNFFILGMIFAGLTGAAEGQGLAGGAIVLFYGMVSGILAFVISLFVVYNMHSQTVQKINKLLLVLFLCFMLFFTIRYFLRKDVDSENKAPPAETTFPVE